MIQQIDDDALVTLSYQARKAQLDDAVDICNGMLKTLMPAEFS